MHMADALISPMVGGTMWAATAGVTMYCGKKVGKKADDGRIPLMGVLGAFVFAAQMVNFTIPGAGSSGHLGGGLILALLLGPHAAFIVMASVLAVQAVFFADGGLLALGCNIFNLGVFPCFVGYPIYRRIAGKNPSGSRATAGAMAGAIIALQAGSLAVVFETVLSGVSELPFSAFLVLMQPIHLAIGIVEGLATAAVLSFVSREAPDILEGTFKTEKAGTRPPMRLLVVFSVSAVLLGGVFSWFASTHPDGLEWSIAKVTGEEELPAKDGGIHGTLARFQEKTAIMPDYALKGGEGEPRAEPAGPVDPGSSAAGLLGGLMVLLLSAAFGWFLKSRKTAPA